MSPMEATAMARPRRPKAKNQSRREAGLVCGRGSVAIVIPIRPVEANVKPSLAFAQDLRLTAHRRCEVRNQGRVSSRAANRGLTGAFRNATKFREVHRA